ncbi:MAG TPA: transglutaminase-like domain-containing protein, partial [Pirellulaceae bacterium]|nr:transglutaminase-like domain-containing protein [Pirellulaceae bacterium]
GVLFAAYPSYRLPETPKEVQFDRDSGQYSMQTSTPWGGLGRVRYDVGTTAFQNGRQMIVTPQELVAEVRDLNRHLTELEGCARFDTRRFPNVARLADEILRDAGAERAGRVRKARVLELHFQQPGRYQYSLNVRTRRRGDLDPVEDFLVNTKAGHCEYFATALALMLRSQGIPSRLVVGYHGGELNPVGNYYLVRQRDAHAWVEAYIRPEDREELNLEEGLTPGQGGWLRLDPTPGAEDGSPTASTGWLGRAEQMLDYAEFLWTDYVLGMNSERQSQTVYDPVFKRWNEQLSAWLDYTMWREWFLEKWRAGGGWKGMVQALIGRPWLIALVTLALFGAIGGGLWARRRGGLLELRAWRIWTSRKATSERRPTIEFYRAFESTMSKRGWRRKPGQTPREWLTELTSLAVSSTSSASSAAAISKTRHTAGDSLATDGSRAGSGRVDLTEPATARSVPTAPSGLPSSLHAAAWLIVDGFYRVRYGGAELAAEESRAIESALAVIQAEN